MKKFLMLMAALTLSAAAWALPTVEQVKTEVNAGRYTQAESMMREVVTAKPDSAKAHYLYAEILAHNRRFEQASQEAKLARQLDSDIRFAKPEEFRSFEQMLERERQAAKASTSAPVPRANTQERVNQQQMAPAPAASTGSGVPGWVWGIGAAAIAVIAWRMMRARSAASTMPAAYPGAAAAGVGPGYQGGPMGGMPMGGMPSGGSGMLGAGLAGAGGFAAGMLAEKLLNPGHGGQSSAGNLASNDGGMTPGMFDNSREESQAATDLENRSIDFGTGDDWGGGGSSDSGGGGGGSDDW